MLGRAFLFGRLRQIKLLHKQDDHSLIFDFEMVVEAVNEKNKSK
jgi:hypothetical protein